MKAIKNFLEDFFGSIHFLWVIPLFLLVAVSFFIASTTTSPSEWKNSIDNPDNDPYIIEVAFNLGIDPEEVTQKQFNNRYTDRINVITDLMLYESLSGQWVVNHPTATEMVYPHRVFELFEYGEMYAYGFSKKENGRGLDMAYKQRGVWRVTHNRLIISIGDQTSLKFVLKDGVYHLSDSAKITTLTKLN